MNRKQRRIEQSQQSPVSFKMTVPHLQLLGKGVELQQKGNLSDAEAIYQTLLTTYPKDITLLYLLGRIHFDRGGWKESLQLLNRAITINPNYDYALFFKGLIKLVHGEFAEGWKLYESRWESVRKGQLRAFPQPLWLGKESLTGKTILLDAEQGLGDTIQMCRYVPLLEALGAKVIFETFAPLGELLSTLKASFQIITEPTPLPTIDFHCPHFSLPLAFNTQLNTIPANVPYLFADSLKCKLWQERLGPKVRLRVGLVWSGSTGHENDYNRSIAFRRLLPLLNSDVEFHSLQKDVRPDDAPILAQQSNIGSHAEHLQDFTDTAALIANMDLVISVDTSAVHLAGALGKPVWILLPYAPDWRWLLDREDSPWYPTARLFRQPDFGDWESVIAKVAVELELFKSQIA